MIPVVRASTAPPLEALDIQVFDDAAWLDIQMIGHSLYRLGHEHERDLVLRPGDAMRIVFYWRAVGDRRPSAQWRVTLQDRKRLVWATPLVMGDCNAPPCDLETRDILRDVQVIVLPADLKPGDYRLSLDTGDVAEGRLLQQITLDAH